MTPQHTTKKMDNNNNRLLLVSLLQASRVTHEKILKRHPAFIGNIKAMLKGPPTGPCYLEVWTPGLQSYGISFGGFFQEHFNKHAPALKELYLMAGMQTSVCDHAAYVMAKAVLFGAISGHVSEAKLCAVVGKDRSSFSQKENLVLDVAEALCKPQPDLTAEQKQQFAKALGSRADFVVFTMLSFTFLNKFTDAIAVELEQRIADIAAGTIAKHGWTPGEHSWLLDPASEPQPYPKPETFLERLKRLRYLPGVSAFISQAEKGVPCSWNCQEPFLKAQLGHSFPVLQHVQTSKLRQGLAALLVRNFDSHTSSCGLPVKCLVGMMFATFVGNATVAQAIRDMSAKVGVSDADLGRATKYSRDLSVFCEEFDNKQVRAMLALCKAMLPTPCQITPAIVDHLRDVEIGGVVITELVVWVSVLAVFHRMAVYYSL